MRRLFVVCQEYVTGYSSHDDYKRVVLVWADTEQLALTTVKASESKQPRGWYDYEVKEVDMTESDEPQTIWYRDNR